MRKKKALLYGISFSGGLLVSVFKGDPLNIYAASIIFSFILFGWFSPLFQPARGSFVADLIATTVLACASSALGLGLGDIFISTGLTSRIDRALGISLLDRNREERLTRKEDLTWGNRIISTVDKSTQTACREIESSMLSVEDLSVGLGFNDVGKYPAASIQWSGFGDVWKKAVQENDNETAMLLREIEKRPSLYDFYWAMAFNRTYHKCPHLFGKSPEPKPGR